jgi:hypothetical protein
MSDESSDNDNEINDDDDDASANNGNTIAEDGIAEMMMTMTMAGAFKFTLLTSC